MKIESKLQNPQVTSERPRQLANEHQAKEKERQRKISVATHQEETARSWSQAELTDCCNKCQHFIRREDPRENNDIVTRLRDKDIEYALKDSEEKSTQ